MSEGLIWEKDQYGNHELITMLLKPDGTIGYSVPGVVPHLMNEQTRSALSQKLIEMSAACANKQWPFEKKS